jgi:hypothetical protein
MHSVANNLKQLERLVLIIIINNKFEDLRYKPVFEQEQEEVGMHRRSVVVSAEKIAKRCNVAISPPHGSNSGVTLCVCVCVSLSLSLSLCKALHKTSFRSRMVLID